MAAGGTESGAVISGCLTGFGQPNCPGFGQPGGLERLIHLDRRDEIGRLGGSRRPRSRRSGGAKLAVSAEPAISVIPAASRGPSAPTGPPISGPRSSSVPELPEPVSCPHGAGTRSERPVLSAKSVTPPHASAVAAAPLNAPTPRTVTH